MNKDEVQEYFGKYIDKNLRRLDDEVKLLREWFKRDFPESTLEVLVDVNNILRQVTITTRVLMGQEMVQNRGFFRNQLVLRENNFIDPGFMSAFFREFNNQYRKQISQAINAHYMREKQFE